MADRKMPNPISVGDEYLAEILKELKGLRADLARAPAAPPEGLTVYADVDVEPAPANFAPSEDPPSGESPPEKSLLQRLIGR